MAFFFSSALLAYVKIIRFHEVNVFPAFQVYETLGSFFNLLLLGIRYMLHVCLMIISVTNITRR